MRIVQCPDCGQQIPAGDIHVDRDVAYCRRCNRAAALSEIVHGEEEPGVDLKAPPAGTWRRSSPWGPVYGASHRSVAGAVGMLAFGLFWNGIVSVFVFFAISGTLYHLGIEAPAWFPAPRMNERSMSLGMVIFLWIFLTPFIVVGLAMIWAFLTALAGRTELRQRADAIELYRGAGPLGWTRRVAMAEVAQIKTGKNRRMSDESVIKPHIEIVLHNGKTITFGSSLPEDRRRFLLTALRQMVRSGPV